MNAVKIQVRDLTFYYGQHVAIDSFDLDVRQGEILGLMGPAKSGKTTFLRVLNRMCDLVPDARVQGSVLLDGEDILAAGMRRRCFAAASGDGFCQTGAFAAFDL